MNPEYCPFCDWPDVELRRTWFFHFYYMLCMLCGARGPLRTTRYWAIRAWNRRFNPKEKKQCVSKS